MWIWSLVLDIPIFQILALYLDFEGAKNIHVLQDLIWGFGGDLRFLAGVLYADINLNIITGLWFFNMILKVQRTSMSFKSSFWALGDAGGSLLGFGILILIWMSLDFDTSMIQILALYLDFEGAKNIHVL